MDVSHHMTGRPGLWVGISQDSISQDLSRYTIISRIYSVQVTVRTRMRGISRWKPPKVKTKVIKPQMCVCACVCILAPAVCSPRGRRRTMLPHSSGAQWPPSCPLAAFVAPDIRQPLLHLLCMPHTIPTSFPNLSETYRIQILIAPASYISHSPAEVSPLVRRCGVIFRNSGSDISSGSNSNHRSILIPSVWYGIVSIVTN